MSKPVAQFVFVCLLACAEPGGAGQAILRYDAIYHPVQGRYGMVVSQRAGASSIGAAVLASGGNAIDASVAVGFALAVNLPRAGNLGGGGFLLFHDSSARKTSSLDFRETAPADATPDMFLDTDGHVVRERYRSSHLSVAVPGTVAGLLAAHARFGRLSLPVLLAPAIQLAESGIPVSYDMASAINSRRSLLTRHAATRRLFFPQDEALEAGEMFVQPELAKTLRQIAGKGRNGFYAGRVADLIVAEMQRSGGLITHQDLLNYKPLWRDPVRGTYRGYDIVAMPPPSAGGVHLIQMLNILERFPLKSLGHNSADMLHLLTEVMKIAYADRSVHLGDPDFHRVPVAWLTAESYAAAAAENISMEQARAAADIYPGRPGLPESVDTTHYSVVDADGNAVAVTYTLNFSFGSGITVPGAGFLLNNEMADFAAKPGSADAFGLITGEANRVVPLKRPLSAMTPAMVLKNNDLVLVTGSPGGSRIINVVLQNIINVLDFDMNIAEAINAPRIHHQWRPDHLDVEPGISPDTRDELKKRGHRLALGASLGSVQAIMRIGPLLHGAADPRRPGAGAVPVNRLQAARP